MRPIPLVLIGILATSCSPTSTVDDPKQDALTAKKILERMAQTYAECKSYRDSGIVKTVFIQTDGKRTVEKPFTTAFVRPDHFRFEYRASVGDNPEYRRHIIWHKGKEVQSWWDLKPGIEQPESLGWALAAASGVSSRSSHTIPALLLPDEVGGWRLTGITEAKRIEDAKLDKVVCFRIQGSQWVGIRPMTGSPMTIWVDKETFLVRRIDSQKTFDNFRTDQTTTYEPVINGEMSDKMLEFDPPRPD